MKDLFKDILSMEDVKGLMLFSFTGELIIKVFTSPSSEEISSNVWWPLFVRSLNDLREADIVYENSRVYIRKTEIGYLMISTGIFTPMAMIRLNCDVLLPSLNKKALRKWL